MANINNYIVVIFYVFFVSVGLIFFFNITLRHVGKVSPINVVLILIFLAISGFYIFSVISYGNNYADSRNTQRTIDIETISNAVQEYVTDLNYKVGELGPVPICPQANYIGSGPGLIDLKAKLQDISLPVLPIDPTKGTETNSGYSMCVTTSSRIVIAAPYAEGDKIIMLKK